MGKQQPMATRVDADTFKPKKADVSVMAVLINTAEKVKEQTKMWLHDTAFLGGAAAYMGKAADTILRETSVRDGAMVSQTLPSVNSSREVIEAGLKGNLPFPALVDVVQAVAVAGAASAVGLAVIAGGSRLLVNHAQKKAQKEFLRNSINSNAFSNEDLAKYKLTPAMIDNFMDKRESVRSALSLSAQKHLENQTSSIEQASYDQGRTIIEMASYLDQQQIEDHIKLSLSFRSQDERDKLVTGLQDAIKERPVFSKVDIEKNEILSMIVSKVTEQHFVDDAEPENKSSSGMGM